MSEESKFNSKARQPIIPLYVEDIDFARSKEFVMNYDTNQAYIKKQDGTLIDICSSSSTFEYIKQYLLDNPDIILSVTITLNNTTDTIKETFNDIYNRIIKLDKREHLYAGSRTNGGPASTAEMVNHSITIEDYIKNIYNGSIERVVNISTLNLFRRSGGYVIGPMTAKKNFLLAKNKSYGFELPETGEEGQIFILLKDDI